MDNSYTKINILTVEKLQIRIQEYLVFLLLLITHWLPLDKSNDFFMPLLPSRKKKIQLEKNYLPRILRTIEHNRESNKK